MDARRVLGAALVGIALAGCSALAPRNDKALVAGPRAEETRRGPRASVHLPDGSALAIVWDRGRDADFLAHVDPQTLEVRRRALLGEQGYRRPALSPDGTQLMFGTNHGGARVFDGISLKEISHVNLGGGWTHEIAWLRPDRAIAMIANSTTTRSFAFDPRSGKVVGTDFFEGVPLRTKRAPEGLVSIVGRNPMDEDNHRPGTAQLSLVIPNGTIRSVELKRIPAGWFVPEDERFGRQIEPALAVRDGVATVVGTNGVIARVDLDSFEITYASADRSFVERVADWLVPSAFAKMSEGTSLWADWFRDVLVVGGHRLELDVLSEGDDGSIDLDERTAPLGVSFVDPETGASTVIDPRADRFARGGGIVLAYETAFVAGGPGRSIGLTAYGPDGQRLWHTFGRRTIEEVTIAGGRAYVRHGWSRVLRSVLDLGTGAVLDTEQTFARVLHL